MDQINPADIYKILDAAGLDSATFLQSKRNITVTLSDVRTRLYQGIVSYIQKREQNMAQHREGQ